MSLKKYFRNRKNRKLRQISGKYDTPPGPITESEKKSVDRLRDDFRNLDIQSSRESEESACEWNRNMSRLKTLVLEEDPRNFLRWDVILKTMFVENAEYIEPEIEYLKQQPNWASRWETALAEDKTGHPLPYWKYPQSSGNLIHHAYHIARFESWSSGQLSEYDFIFEFGGGYGSMCRLIHRLGFQGTYVLFDLPAFSLLQKYYLRSIGRPVLEEPDECSNQSAIVCLSSIESVQKIIRSCSAREKTLFLATWSISETPLQFRSRVFDLIRDFDSFLIAYQERFNEVDNVKAFSEFQKQIHDCRWEDIPIRHIRGANRYLFGIRQPYGKGD